MEAGPHLDALSETHASGRTQETVRSVVARADGAKLSTTTARFSHLDYMEMI